MRTRLPSRWILSTLLALAVATPLAAWASFGLAGPSSVGFQAKGPAGMRIDGSTSGVSVADDGQNVTVTVRLGDLATGLALRDSHMKDALQTPSYPTATLRLSRGELKVPAVGQATSGDLSGQLALHGQTRAVPVHYDAKNEGGVMRVSASFPANMTDFGITPPGYLGVSVKPDVSVWAKLQLQDR